jgi:hypothetical protein
LPYFQTKFNLGAMGVLPLVFILILVGCFAAFFFWHWLFAKFISHQRTRVILTGIAIFFTIPVAYYVVTGAIMLWLVYTPKRDFDQEDWLADKAERYQMADDIIESKMLLGIDTMAVKQLLGEPSWRGDSVWHSNGANSWHYDMGSGGAGLGFTFHHLHVKFANDKVDSVYHITIDD